MEEQPIPTEDPGSSPLLRIWLCGPFEMAWVDPATGASLPIDPTTTGRDRGPALSLLKLLLCHPERQAPRDWIMEQFWPEHSRSVAIHRLENVFSRLRKLLTPPGGGESLLHSLRSNKSSGPSYGLDAYPTLWIDSDALTWHVEQAARLERFGDNALPLWQRAFALLTRGPFLADEPYATWVTEQRAVLDGDARQCVHALSRLYLAHYGEAGKAEALLLLRTYWQQHQTDEDALRPLMELLGEQERYQEAEEYYRQLLLALAELGPDAQGQPHTPDVRTSDIREYLRTKQIRRNRVSTPAKAETPILNVHPMLSKHLQGEKQALYNGNLSVSKFSPSTESNDDELLLVTSEQMLSVGIGGGIGASIAQIITEIDDWIGHAAFCQELQPILAQKIRRVALQSGQLNEQNRLSEQESLLTALATLPQAVLTSFQQKRRSEIQIEAFLPRCSASITACWFLMSTSSMVLVEQILLAYLPLLETLAQQYSKYQSAAAHLASQGCMLRAILTLHQLALTERELFCRQAVNYSETSGDTRLQAGAWMYLGYIHCYRGKPDEAILAFLQALRYLGKLQSLLRSDIYMALAYAYGQCKQEQEAHHALTLAQKYFPSFPEHDPSYLYASCGLSALYIWEGRTYLALGEHYPDRGYYQKAWDALAQIKGTSPASERDRTEILIYQSKAALGRGDLTTGFDYLGMGLDAAEALGSKRRVSESCDVYLEMCQGFPNELRTKTLAERFRPYLLERMG